MQAEVNQMTTGPSRTRATDTVVFARHTGSILLTSVVQLQMWNTFWTSTTAFGSISFTWVDPYDNSSHFYKIFSQPQVMTLAPTVFSVSLTIEEVPQ